MGDKDVEANDRQTVRRETLHVGFQGLAAKNPLSTKGGWQLAKNVAELYSVVTSYLGYGLLDKRRLGSRKAMTARKDEPSGV